MAESELTFPSLFESKFEVSDTAGKKDTELRADNKTYVLRTFQLKGFFNMCVYINVYIYYLTVYIL